jgi:hypothetical protein
MCLRIFCPVSSFYQKKTQGYSCHPMGKGFWTLLMCDVLWHKNMEEHETQFLTLWQTNIAIEHGHL